MQVDVLIVGGGAAGFFVAANLNCRIAGRKVALLESGRKPLTKVKVSGGGRCNFTHHQFDPRLLCKNYPRGSRELLGAFNRFQPRDMIEWMSSRGVESKVESDGRMFPVSDESQTIIDALMEAAHENGVQCLSQKQVASIAKEGDRFFVRVKDGSVWDCSKVVLATGGSEAGHRLARELGHTIVEPVPSLFTFNIGDPRLDGLAGLSFESIEVSLKFGKKKFSQEGPMLITHWGLSGPAILKLSAWAARDLCENEYSGILVCNFAPGKNSEQVFEELWNLIQSERSKALRNVSVPWLPKRYWQQLLGFKIGEDKKCMDVSKKEARQLAEQIVRSEFKFSGKSRNKEEFVTAGGVKLKEVDFRTMESRVCSGLYIVGELLDVDGVTGGFNFQNAWTTGKIAADSILQPGM